MSYKILIVEDDPMVAMINEQYATKNPDFVSAGICRNGKDALEFLSKNKVDLVVLDVYMPYMDGVETLKKIREQNIQTQVIMVTAANDTSTLERTMNLGVVDYLVKPFAMERFQVALQKFAAKASALRQGKGGSLDQSSIDTIIGGTAASPKMAAALSDAPQNSAQAQKAAYPKGIQKQTLQTIQEYFDKNPNWQRGDIVAQKLGLSVVTVRHYLNFLVDQRQLTQTIDYETGGRPSMLYRKAGK